MEAAVEQRIRSFLGDEADLYPPIAPRCSDPARVRSVISDLGTRAARWSASDHPTRITLFDRLVDQVTVRADRVDIEVRPEALTGLGDLRAQSLVAAPEGDSLHDAPTHTLSVPARLKRVGTAMRLMLEVPHAAHAPKPDRSLLRLLGQAHRFRDLLLRRDGRTIAELAEEAGVTASWFARVVRLSFLSPRITSALVDGTQPLERRPTVSRSWDRCSPRGRTNSGPTVSFDRLDQIQAHLKPAANGGFSASVNHRFDRQNAKRSEKVGSRDIGAFDGANSGANGSVAGVAGWVPVQAFEITL